MNIRKTISYLANRIEEIYCSIICDDDFLGCLAVAALDFNPELLGLAHGLVGYGQWGQNEHPLVCFANDVLGPHQFHRGLAKATVGKDSGAALEHGPLNQCLLEIK